MTGNQDAYEAHKESAEVLEQAADIVEKSAEAVRALTVLRNVDFPDLGYGHLIGNRQPVKDPEWHGTFTAVTRCIERVRRIARRGLKNANR